MISWPRLCRSFHRPKSPTSQLWYSFGRTKSGKWAVAMTLMQADSLYFS